MLTALCAKDLGELKIKLDGYKILIMMEICDYDGEETNVGGSRVKKSQGPESCGCSEATMRWEQPDGIS